MGEGVLQSSYGLPGMQGFPWFVAPDLALDEPRHVVFSVFFSVLINVSVSVSDPVIQAAAVQRDRSVTLR